MSDLENRHKKNQNTTCSLTKKNTPDIVVGKSISFCCYFVSMMFLSHISARLLLRSSIHRLIEKSLERIQVEN